MRNLLRRHFDKVARRLFTHMPAPPNPFPVARGDAFDLRAVAAYRAAEESAEYMLAQMHEASFHANYIDLLTFAVRLAKPGQFLEFGVASGQTINHIASHHGGHIAGFDSFKGLPEAWRPGYPPGFFDQAQMPAVPPHVELIAGWFDATLPAYLSAHPEPISFVHVDCDLYSSTKTIFDFAGPLMAPGCVIVFDEYFNYPGWQQHEHRAYHEFLAASGRAGRYVALVPSHQQVCVVLD